MRIDIDGELQEYLREKSFIVDNRKIDEEKTETTWGWGRESDVPLKTIDGEDIWGTKMEKTLYSWKGFNCQSKALATWMPQLLGL